MIIIIILTTLIVVVHLCDTIFGSLVLLRFWGEFSMDYGEHNVPHNCCCFDCPFLSGSVHGDRLLLYIREKFHSFLASGSIKRFYLRL